MFGNKNKNLPWCCGYAVGYYLIQKYIQKVGVGFRELIETKLCVENFEEKKELKE